MMIPNEHEQKQTQLISKLNQQLEGKITHGSRVHNPMRGEDTWKADDRWQQMPPQQSSTAPNDPCLVHHQQAFISLSQRTHQ